MHLIKWPLSVVEVHASMKHILLCRSLTLSNILYFCLFKTNLTYRLLFGIRFKQLTLCMIPFTNVYCVLQDAACCGYLLLHLWAVQNDIYCSYVEQSGFIMPSSDLEPL